MQNLRLRTLVMVDMHYSHVVTKGFMGAMAQIKQPEA
jgi:hypothetical protein